MNFIKLILLFCGLTFEEKIGAEIINNLNDLF